jgi:hypothetical protein
MPKFLICSREDFLYYASLIPIWHGKEIIVGIKFILVLAYAKGSAYYEDA